MTTIKISGNLNFTKCLKESNNQLNFCSCKQNCRKLKMSDGSLKTVDNQTFWIFNLSKTSGEICRQNISCQNSKNVSFGGKIVEMKEEPPSATSVTEMVIQHCVNKACSKD